MAKYIRNFQNRQLSEAQIDAFNVMQETQVPNGTAIPFVYVYGNGNVYITKVIKQSHSG